MVKKMMYAAAAAAAFAVAAPASAAVITITSDPDPCTMSDPVCTFTFDMAGVAAGAFDDSGTFSLPQMGLTSGIVSTIAAGGSGDIEFSRVFLTIGGTDYDFAITNGIASLAVLIDQSSLPGLATITVQGTANTMSGYSGDLTFVAVPEPSTWALFILGFGGLGYAMRRRNAKVKVAKSSLRFA